MQINTYIYIFKETFIKLWKHQNMLAFSPPLLGEELWKNDQKEEKVGNELECNSEKPN